MMANYEIIQRNYKDNNITDYLKMIIPETNIEILEIDTCDITKIYDSILHLKLLKTIIIKNCPEFSESFILKQNGYIVELY